MDPTSRRTPIRPWMVIAAVAAMVLIAAGFSTKVVSIADADAASAGGFDPASFASEHFEEISDTVTSDAIELRRPALPTRCGRGRGRLRQHLRRRQRLRVPGHVHSGGRHARRPRCR